MKVYYEAGPGDVAGTFHHWERGAADPSQIATTYSSQFFDACRALGLSAFVSSTCSRVERIERDWITIDQRPTRAINLPKVGYYAQLAGGCLRNMGEIASSRCDTALLLTNPMSALYSVLPLFGVRVFTSLHASFDQELADRPAKLPHRLLMQLTGQLFLRRATSAIMAVSPLVLRQASRYASCPGIVFRPHYAQDAFHDTPPPAHDQKPFRALYSGRVELNKGVLDLVQAASILARDGGDFFFDIAGDGSALEEMHAHVRASGLQSRFAFHGHCTSDKLAGLFAQCHAVIVPTRSDFHEGLNKVVVESVLSGRPAVVSSVCPALEYFPEALLVVPPDRADCYADALRNLAEQPDVYRRAQGACARLAQEYRELPATFYAVLKTILAALQTNEPVDQAFASLSSPWLQPPSAAKVSEIRELRPGQAPRRSSVV